MTFWIFFDDTFSDMIFRFSMNLCRSSRGISSPCARVWSPARSLMCFFRSQAASVSLLVHSESDVDEDSWITFSDVLSSGNELLVLRYNGLSLAHYFQAFMGVVSDIGSLIVTPPTGA
ncbi:hypothetical protein Tco_0058287 [Tanacetum coccineum]